MTHQPGTTLRLLAQGGTSLAFGIGLVCDRTMLSYLIKPLNRAQLINSWALADVCFDAHDGLTSDIARGPESARFGHASSYRREVAPTASGQCDLRTVFPKVISGLRRPIAIQAAISLNMNLPE
jgi:hypothetical protein